MNAGQLFEGLAELDPTVEDDFDIESASAEAADEADTSANRTDTTT